MEMLGMFFSGRAGDEYVVQVDEYEVQAPADLIHEVLKGLCGIAQSMWHSRVFEKAESCDDGRLRSVRLCHGDLVIGLHQIDL